MADIGIFFFEYMLKPGLQGATNSVYVYVPIPLSIRFLDLQPKSHSQGVNTLIQQCLFTD